MNGGALLDWMCNVIGITKGELYRCSGLPGCGLTTGITGLDMMAWPEAVACTHSEHISVPIALWLDRWPHKATPFTVSINANNMLEITVFRILEFLCFSVG